MSTTLIAHWSVGSLTVNTYGRDDSYKTEVSTPQGWSTVARTSDEAAAKQAHRRAASIYAGV
jgi:hypothetical protein